MKFLDLKHRLKQALLEDGAFNDATTLAIPKSKQTRLRYRLIAKKEGIFCGAFLLKPVFSLLDSGVKISCKKRDGDRIRPRDTIAVIQGKSFALLGGERLYLNLACELSGIATLTRKYVEAVKGTKSRIFDTRKTTPLWRDLEKFAVKCGGGGEIIGRLLPMLSL
ncbi:hypothetical protein BVX98_04875 [bacterium F11]|nr:hypothetical protein BVX98_04875 [bacterium F11]